VIKNVILSEAKNLNFHSGQNSDSSLHFVPFRMTFLLFLPFFFFSSSILFSFTKKPKTQSPKPKTYIIPRPAIAGLHLAMSIDSANIILKKVASRKTVMTMDSISLIESDSVRIFGEAAFLQLQILHNKIRTLVVNFHPLSGDHYLNTRNTLNSYMENAFGRGVITSDENLIYRRWESDDGTMEVSYSDKYTRVFVRLGKR
jgi:hypothetical protein